MRHRILPLGVFLSMVGLIGRYAVFTFVLDPNSMSTRPPPLPFYAIPVSAITVLLILFGLPVAIVIEVVQWRIKVRHQEINARK